MLVRFLLALCLGLALLGAAGAAEPAGGVAVEAQQVLGEATDAPEMLEAPPAAGRGPLRSAAIVPADAPGPASADPRAFKRPPRPASARA